MPRPKKPVDGLAPTYVALRVQSDIVNEHNDCAVVAVAAATGVQYDEVLRRFQENGRKDRQGTQRCITRRVVEELGWTVEEIYGYKFLHRYPEHHRKHLQSVTTHHPDRFKRIWKDGERYLLFSNGHVGAVVDGVNYDWTRGRAKRVWMIWKLTKNSADTSAPTASGAHVRT